MYLAGYKQAMPGAADYVIDFDDLDGLHAYLRHPAHAELFARLNQSLASALTCNFDAVGIEGLARLV